MINCHFFLELRFNEGQPWLAHALINTAGCQKRQANCCASLRDTVRISSVEKMRQKKSFLNWFALNSVYIWRLKSFRQDSLRQRDLKGTVGASWGQLSTTACHTMRCQQGQIRKANSNSLLEPSWTRQETDFKCAGISTTKKTVKVFWRFLKI